MTWNINIRKTLDSKPITKINLQALLAGDPAEARKCKVYTSFMDHSLPYLSAIKPLAVEGKYQFSSIIDQIKEDPDATVEVNGHTVTLGWIGDLIKVFALTNRSTILAGVQTEMTRLSAGVPWTLWAYKSNRGINYESWDKSDPKLRFALSKYLTPILDPIELDPLDDLAYMRRTALEVKSTHEHMHEVTNRLSSTNNKIFDNLKVVVRQIILQTWCWAPSIRNAAMITDLNNWDNLAEPIEDPQPLTEKPTKSKKVIEHPDW